MKKKVLWGLFAVLVLMVVLLFASHRKASYDFYNDMRYYMEEAQGAVDQEEKDAIRAEVTRVLDRGKLYGLIKIYYWDEEKDQVCVEDIIGGLTVFTFWEEEIGDGVFDLHW